MKKILSMLLAFTIACTNFTGVANLGVTNPLNSTVVSAEDDDGLSLVALNDTFVNGAFSYEVYSMADDGKSGSVKVTAYNGSATTLNIPSSATYEKVYNDDDDLVSGDGISYTVTTVDGSILSSNSSKANIETIVIPNTITTIGNSAFSALTALKTVTFTGTSKVASIGNSVFSGCTSLGSITIPSSVTSIGTDVFSGCSATVNYTSELTNTIDDGWKALVTADASNNNTYVNSKATALVLDIANDNKNTNPKIGDTLTVSADDSYEFDISSYDISWFVSGTEEAILSGTGEVEFDVDNNDYEGKTITVKVTVPKSQYYYKEATTTPISKTTGTVSDSKDTLPTPVITVAKGTGVKEGTVATPIVGNTLTVSVGEGDSAVDSSHYDIAWYVTDDGTYGDADTNTGSSFTVLADHVDEKIKVVVTAKGDSYKDHNTNYAETGAVSDGKVAFPTLKLENSSTVNSSDSPKVGDTLTLKVEGDDTFDFTGYTVTWHTVEGETVSGSIGSGTSYDIVAGNIDKQIRATVSIGDSDVTYIEKDYSITTKNTVQAINGLEAFITIDGEIATGGADVGDVLGIEVYDEEDNLVDSSEYTLKWTYYSGVIGGSSETGETLTVADGKQGNTIKVVITFDGKGDYKETTITESINVLKDLEKVTITGNTRLGETLTVKFNGTTAVDTDDYKIYWYLDGADAPFEMNNSAELYLDPSWGTAVLGEKIRVEVFAVDNDVYNDQASDATSSEISLPSVPEPVITIKDKDGVIVTEQEKIKVSDELTVSVSVAGITAEDLANPDKYKITWYTNKKIDNASTASNVPGMSSYDLSVITEEDDEGFEVEVTTTSIKLTSDYEGLKIKVSVTPVEGADTGYDHEYESFSNWTYEVLDEYGKVYLTDVEIAYSDDGSKLVVSTLNEGAFADFDSAEYTYAWYKNGALMVDEKSYEYELQADDMGKTFYVTVSPSSDNKHHKLDENESPIKSDEITIKQNLPNLVVTSDNDDWNFGDQLLVGDTLTVDFVSGAALESLENLYIEWYVGDVVKKQGLYTSGSTSNMLIIDKSYSNKDVYVKVTNKTGTNENTDYNNVPVNSGVVGKVEIISFAFTYDLNTLVIGAPDYGTILEYGEDLDFTLALPLALPSGTDTSKYSLPRDNSDIIITVDGIQLAASQYEYNSTTGAIEIQGTYVTGAVHVQATAYTIFPDTSVNVPTIYLDDSMTGVTSSRYTLTDADINSDGWYEFKLTAVTLPDDIEIKFGATANMSILDGYFYYKDTGIIEINPAKFGSTLGYYATISGTWDNGNNNSATAEYSVNLSASGTGINAISQTDSVKEGGIYTVNFTLVSDAYQTPITINSITMNGTTISNTDYSITGTTLYLNSGYITSDCSIVISANATSGKYEVVKVSPYIGSNISLLNATGTAIIGETYTMTLVPTDDYSLPSSVTVTMEDEYGNVEVLTTSQYSYNSNTGVLSIPNVTGAISITVNSATYANFYNISHDLDGVECASGDTGTGIVKEGDSYTATFFTINTSDYYDLTIGNFYITMGSVNITNDVSFTPETGKLIIPSVTGNVSISVTATSIPSEHDLWFSLWGLYSNAINDDNIITLNHGTTDYSIYLKVKSGWTSSYEVPDTIRVHNTRTELDLVEGTDYSYTITSGTDATLTIYSVEDALSIYALAKQIDGTDGEYDSDADDDDSNSDGGSSSSTYTITFVDTSGSTISTSKTDTDKTLSSLPSYSTTDSYAFLGWYTNAGTKVTTSTVFTGNTTLYAKVVSIVTPNNNGNGQYYISTVTGEVAMYANQLQGGTITVSGANVNNFVIIPPSSGYSTTASTNIVLPDSNGNTVTWTIPAGSIISDTNYLNLAVRVSEYPINTTTSLGRSLGYLDFVHEGNLLSNYLGLTLTFRNYNVSTGDTLQLYKLDTFSELTNSYVAATAIGNSYVRVTMYSCSKWELIARNYSYNPDGSGGGSYTQYFNIPTTGYIAELRNVRIGQVLDLTTINVGNGLIIEGWYYDQLFTNRVTNPSYVVVSEAIIQSGLYPKYVNDYTTPDSGNPWPDSGNGYNPDLSDNPTTNSKIIALF